MGKKKKKKSLNIKKTPSSEDKKDVTQVEKTKRSNITFDYILKVVISAIAIGALLYFVSYISHKEPVIIGVPDDYSSRVVASYLQEKISEEFDVSIQLKSDKNGSGFSDTEVFEKMQEGIFDIHPSVWSPQYDEFIDKYDGKVVKSKSSYGAESDLCMIRSVAEKYDIDEVTDLSNKVEKATIWLGEKGGILTDYNIEKAEKAGYLSKFDLKHWDTEEAMEKIEEYEESEKPFVFFCYNPSAITKESYDAVALEDAEESTSVHIAYSTFMEDKYPEIVKYINKLDLSLDEVNKMILDAKEEDQS